MNASEYLLKVFRKINGIKIDDLFSKSMIKTIYDDDKYEIIDKEIMIGNNKYNYHGMVNKMTKKAEGFGRAVLYNGWYMYEGQFMND